MALMPACRKRTGFTVCCGWHGSRCNLCSGEHRAWSIALPVCRCEAGRTTCWTRTQVADAAGAPISEDDGRLWEGLSGAGPHTEPNTC